MTVNPNRGGWLFLISMLVLFSGCGAEDATIKVPLDIDSLLEKEVSIYDLFSKVEVISLDNSIPLSNSVYSGISKIAYNGRNFYILDEKTLAIHIYDSEGGLVNRADKTGRGPGEFTMACQIFCNEYTNMVEILNPMGRILRYDADSLKFDSELNYVGKSLPATHNCFPVNSGYILYSDSYEDKLWHLDAETLELCSFGYCPPSFLKDYIYVQAPLFEINGNICFFRPYDGKIYSLDMEHSDFEACLEWDLGGCQCELKDIPKDKAVLKSYDFIMKNSEQKVSPFIEIKACGSYLFASAIYKGRPHTLYYNRDNGKACFFEKTIEGMSFSPELFADGVMYKFVDSEYLPEYVSKCVLDELSSAEYDKVMKEGGAAIIKYHLQKSDTVSSANH